MTLFRGATLHRGVVCGVGGAVVVVLSGCGASSQDGAAPPAPEPVVSALPTGTPSAPSSLPSQHGPEVAPPELLTGNLGFTDQVSDGTALVGSAEIDGSAGWVVVRADRAGAPGAVLAAVYRPDGKHDDVVTVRFTRRASGPLWVSLNVDAGVPHRLDLPGPDRPLQFAGADLVRRVVLTVR
jgi:hypothetical protein